MYNNFVKNKNKIFTNYNINFIVRHIISNYSEGILNQLFQHFLMTNYNICNQSKTIFHFSPSGIHLKVRLRTFLFTILNSIVNTVTYTMTELVFLFECFRCGSTLFYFIFRFYFQTNKFLHYHGLFYHSETFT